MTFNLLCFIKKFKLAGVVLVLGYYFMSCKSLDPTAQFPQMQIPTPQSSVNVPLDIPMATLANLANQAVPPGIFDEKGMDLGNGLIGDLNFSRNGMIQLAALDSQRLQVIFPLKIQGEIGLKPGGLRNLFQSKIPIDRVLSPVFVLDPKMNSNWSLGIDEFELTDLGGKMSFSALGMELDLSPMIRNEIRAFAQERLTSTPDLINLRPLVDATWNQVGRPVFVNFEGKQLAFSIKPDAIKINEYLNPAKGFHLDLGMIGQVQLHPAQAAPSRPFPLPSITTNSDTSNHLKITIPLHVTYAELDQMIRQSFEGQAIRVNKKYLFQPSNFRTKPYGDRLGVLMDFIATSEDEKEISGELFLAGIPVFDQEAKVLAFDKVNFNLQSSSSKARFGANVKRRKILKQLNQRMKFSLEEALEGSLEGIRERLAIQTPFADLMINELQVFPLGFYPTATGLEIQFKANGKVEVNWK